MVLSESKYEFSSLPQEDTPSAKTSQRVDLDTAGNRFRYYLVWITKLPPGADQVQISEIRLFK